MESCWGAEIGNFVRRLHEDARRAVSTSDDGRRDRPAARDAEDRSKRLICGPGGRRHRCRPALGIAEQGRSADSIAVSWWTNIFDQRPACIRGGRSGAVAWRPWGRQPPGRTLGCRRASGTDRGPQHDGTTPAIRRRAVLLEHALQRRHPLCRSRGEVGRHRDRRAGG